MLRFSRTALASAGLVLSSAPSALAETRSSLLSDFHPHAPPVVVEGSLGFFRDTEGSATLNSFPMVLSASYRIASAAQIELDWPLSSVFGTSTLVEDQSFDALETGNPFVAGYYTYLFKAGYLRAGLGVGLPLASVDLASPYPERDLLVLSAATVTMGMWDLWLFAPERLSFVAPMQAEWQHDALVIGSEVTAAVLLSTEDRLHQDSALMLQGALLLGARLDTVTFGLRLQLVAIEQEAESDGVQTALVPFVQLDLAAGAFFHTRFVLPLDEPIGVASNNFSWGLHIGGGGRL